MEPCRTAYKIEIHKVGYHIPVDLFYSRAGDGIGDVSVPDAVCSHGLADRMPLYFNGIFCIDCRGGSSDKTGFG